MEEKISKGIEKTLLGVTVAGGLGAGYIAVKDFMQLHEVNFEGLYCIVQDPRLLISAGVGLSAKGISIAYKSWNKRKEFYSEQHGS